MRTTMVDVIYKKCSRCGIEKELNANNFNRDKYTKSGYRSSCRDCEKKYRQEHKEKRNAKRREYYRENRDKEIERCKKYFEKHPNYRKEWYLKNKEYKLEKTRQYYKDHKEWHNEYTKQYYLDHKDEVYKRLQRTKKEKGYGALHQRTYRFIKKYNIRPEMCSICGSKEYIYAHHPSNDVWNEIVFCCKSCHQRIHSGVIKCPQPINLLKLI